MPPSQGKSPLEQIFQKADDCDRPACEETVSALSKALSRMGSKAKTAGKKSGSMKGEGSSTSMSCPPTKDEIGRSSWTLLHSMAAWYPERPTSDEKSKMKQLIEAISVFYPCTYCAEDFRENLKENPTKAESRQDLCIWLCEQHNVVNKKLGKPIFKCNIDILDERWRKGKDSKCGN